jgi:hypothetical protein
MATKNQTVNLGFKISGLGDLGKLESALYGAIKKVETLAKAMSDLTSTKPKSGIASFDKWFNEGKSGAAEFARGLSNVAAGARLISAHPLALAAIAAVKLGSAIVEVGAAYLEAGIHAATLRQNMQLIAKGQGTTARKVDGVYRTYEALGLSAQDGEKEFGGFAERLNASFNKPGGTAWLERLGVRTVDENKNRLDTADIFTSALQRAADQAKGLQDRRDKLEADQKAGKAVDPAEWSKLREDTRGLHALLRENFKFGDKTIGALTSVGSGADLLRKSEAAKSRLPPASKEDEARSQRIAEKGQELYQSMEALDQMFGRLRAIITDNLLGPLNAMASGLVSMAKWFGFIPQTEKEIARLHSQLLRRLPPQATRSFISAVRTASTPTVQLSLH